MDPKRSREKWNLGPKRSNSVRIGSFNTPKDRFGVGGWEKIPQKDRARSCQSEKRGSKPRHICITHHIGSTPPGLCSTGSQYIYHIYKIQRTAVLKNFAHVAVFPWEILEGHIVRCKAIFPNFNSCSIEVWEWISNFIPHFIMNVITYQCWDYSYTMFVKGGPMKSNFAWNLRIS